MTVNDALINMGFNALNYMKKYILTVYILNDESDGMGNTA